MDNSLPTQPIVPSVPTTPVQPAQALPTAPITPPWQPPSVVQAAQGLPPTPVAQPIPLVPPTTAPTPPKSGSKFLFILIPILLILVVAGVGAFYYLQNNPNPFSPPVAVTPSPQPDLPEEPVACTLEAKICPDGSSVGRTGPNCEFAECPAEISTDTFIPFAKEEWGMSLKHPANYQVISNTADLVEIGFDGFTYLSISSKPVVFDENNICSSTTTTYPCIHAAGDWGQAEAVETLTIGQKSAKSFYIGSGGTDGDYHIVNITNSIPLQLKMYVSGGGLDQQFQKVLETVEFK